MIKDPMAPFRAWGAQGGSAKGKTKKRGTKQYYRDLAAKRWSKRKST